MQTRDVFILPNTRYDTLDFVSENIGLGGEWELMSRPRFSVKQSMIGVPLESETEVVMMVKRR